MCRPTSANSVNVGYKGQDITPRPGPATARSIISQQVEAYLATFCGQVGLGQKSNARGETLKHHLNRFRNWTPAGDGQALGTLPPDTITARALTGYHGHLAQLIGAGEIKYSTGRDALAAAKQFVRWMWENEVIDAPPRNLDSRALNIQVSTTEPNHWTLEEVRRLLANATERAELYLLVALNTGATQVDLSDLERGEFDPETGTIERKRSKTQHHDGVPVVRYRLWPRQWSC